MTVHRAAGDIHITADGAATNSPYVRELRVNGKQWSQTWLPESFAESGGTLTFTLGSTPDKQWGSSATAAPPSFD